MKKTVKFLISIFLISLLAITLCACNIEDENCDTVGHNLIQSSYTAPTCKTTGEEVKKCSRCGFESKTTLLTIAHNFEVKSTTESTCTTRGSQTSECSMCHETKTTTLELKEHDYKLINSTPSTCVVKGHNDYHCNDCSATKTEELDLANHNYAVVTTGATCFTHGNTKEICNVCSDTKLLNETPLLTHSFETDGYCSKCGIFETLFDEEKLETKFNGRKIIINNKETWENLSNITGSLSFKFKNDIGNIPNSYWESHKVTIRISIFDKDNNLLENNSFESSTLETGELVIVHDAYTIANKFSLYLAQYNSFSAENLRSSTSFKLEISCEGYKTIEKTYQLTENTNIQ